MTTEGYQPAPFSPEHTLHMTAHHESIKLLDEAQVICDFDSIPSGGGFTLIEQREEGPVQHDFYRRIAHSDPALEPPSAPEWYLVAGEGEERTLWPVILHGAMSPNGYTSTSSDVRQSMLFCYQELVSFLSEEDAPPAEKLQRPEEFENRPFPKPAELSGEERLRLIEAGHIYMSETGEWRWLMPGVNFYTGPIDTADYLPPVFTADDAAEN